SAKNGRFDFKQLPAGTYELLVPAVGFTLDKFERKNIAIGRGQTSQQDIKMEWGANLGTPGDDPSIFMRAQYANTCGAANRAVDGRPDPSGVWNGNDDPNPVDPPMLPWAEAITKDRIANSFRDTPSAFCLPSGPLLTGPVLFKFIQTPK